jgi:hypothetical protein
MERRNFIQSILLAASAPAIIQIDNLMKLRPKQYIYYPKGLHAMIMVSRQIIDTTRINVNSGLIIEPEYTQNAYKLIVPIREYLQGRIRIPIRYPEAAEAIHGDIIGCGQMYLKKVDT